MEIFYDLHIHSCLSPCGDADMTPGNICGMAHLAGLGAVALTDHNTCGNTRAFCKQAAQMGLIGVPGMELTTREEIHVVCLFPHPDAAEAFARYVQERLLKEENRPDIFGEQLLVDGSDHPCGTYPWLLTNAAGIGIYDVASLVANYDGFAFPAHIDRASYSLLSVLGLWDDDMGFGLCEYHTPPENTHPIDYTGGINRQRGATPLGAKGPIPYLTDSDAHWLTAIPDGHYTISLPEPSAAALIAELRRIAGGRA